MFVLLKIVLVGDVETIYVYVVQKKWLVLLVYVNEVIDECNDGGNWRSLILLIPVRLGAEKFNSIYAPCLTALLSLEQCIGIIGGRPKHSLYFVGYQG